MMHTGIGRTHPLHIEYMHISAALAVIQDILSEAILSHPRLALARKIAVVKALGKVIWIQNDLFAKWYVVDGEEFTDGVDYAALLDREGYLRGKKVLVPEEGEGEGLGQAADSPPSTCPFTGAVMGTEGLGPKVTGEKAMSDVKGDVPKGVKVVVDGE
jgi:hypothetical protein